MPYLWEESVEEPSPPEGCRAVEFITSPSKPEESGGRLPHHHYTTQKKDWEKILLRLNRT